MLPKKYNATESENKWQNYWKDHGIYKFDKDSQKEKFSIDTPPPTVNGKIHIGHIFSYSQAEMMARYKRMKGYSIFYPFGFDDNGLPTERLVEKKYKVKAHQLTREKFTELCLKETESLEKQFKELFLSAGFSCNWEYEYSTISHKAQLTSQKSFIEMCKDGKAYFKKAPALWCTECQTAIAQAELETKLLPSTFNYLKFYLENSNDFIEIATTRPELLSACNCIFINPNDQKNSWLLGQKVKVPLYDFLVPILCDDKVDMDKGSGLVMCCTFGDLTDLEWFKKHNLEFKEIILQDGTMSELAGKYKGLSVKDARKVIIDDLIAEEFIIRQENLEHYVATHERCETPMEITIKKQWFIDILSDKQKYIDAGNAISWYPEHMKNRYINWVENLEWDWCISRQRFFGVPFPVWYCKECGSPIFADLDQLPINPLSVEPNKRCDCGCNELIPESDILDTWATSSVSPLINLGWYDPKIYDDEMIPMGLRPNAHDIIRTWDFYTIVKVLYHTGKLPWNNIMISGHVMAGKSEKISKRKENSKMEPSEIISTHSADAVRLWAATGSLGNDIVFSEEEIISGKKLINKLWNASKFAIMHLEGFDKILEDGSTLTLEPFNICEDISLLIMDEWIVQLYNNTLEKYFNYLEKYEIGLALGEIEKFFWYFCDDYIEIVKNRLYKPEVYGENARKSGLYASYYVMLGIIKCFAIYIPHITEEIYQGYFYQFEESKSVHISSLQTIPIQSITDTVKLLEVGDVAIEIISQLRRYKSENSLSLKAVIECAIVHLCDNIDIGGCIMDIKATCSCNKIEIKTGAEKIFVEIVE